MRIPPFRLEVFFSKYEFKASYLLCNSDCESFSVEELLSFEPDSFARFRKQWLGYTETQGNPELRQEIARLYQQIDADSVLVHTGAEEPIFVFLNAMLRKGDHAIVHYPCYQSLYEVPRVLGCEVTKWEAQEENGWELDIDFLERSIRENTRVIIVNCPHNPTGYLMSQEKFSRILEIANRHDILVFSDEVYRLLEYATEDRLSAACDLYENAVSLGVMSKAYGLAGLRIGWIATQNQKVLQGMASVKHYLSICNSAPSEFLATLALRNRDRIIERNLRIIKKNLRSLNTFFDRFQDFFDWQPPKAGPIAFPRIRMETDIDKFCMDLLGRKDVLLLPSHIYDYGDKNFRIGFGRKNLPDSLERLEQYMQVTGF